MPHSRNKGAVCVNPDKGRQGDGSVVRGKFAQIFGLNETFTIIDFTSVADDTINQRSDKT